jgi:AcrR family transcriptional regulator
VSTGPSTAVADVARLAGVSTGALQYHFPSKTDLLVAVVEGGWNDLVERTMSAPRSGSPADRVAALVWSVWEAYRQPACRAAFMISSDPNLDADVAERTNAAFDTARSQLDQLWVDTFADLDVPIERITTARRFARSHLNGMVVQRQMASVEPEPDDELELLCQAVLSILTRPSV